MVSKFSPGDIVIWENRLFSIKNVVYTGAGGPSLSFTYGLVPIDKPNDFNQLLVVESLLCSKNTEESVKALKVLYGN
jgi:hypothetical protein